MKYIKLTKGKRALVDNEDFESINKWKWHFDSTGYAVHKGNGKVYMHQLVNKTPKGLFTDHINRNKLDNRRKNLRTCTQSMNMFNTGKQKNNTSGHTGVVWYKRDKTWQAQIKLNQKLIFLGRFTNIRDAIIARCKAKDLITKFI